MLLLPKLALVASVALISQTTNAFWRMPCGIIQLGRIDPIINPGTISGHTHIISGPNNFDQNSNYDILRQSQCTSCTIQADKSAYWTPSLYYEKANGSFVSVPDSGVIIYYLGRGVGNATAFPPGFQMVSGVPGRRSYDSSTLTYGTSQYPSRPVADRVSFNCIDYNNPKPETHGFPTNFNCPGGFRAQIHFPTCWDGINLYKSDQSHVAYLSQVDNGICPPTHPVLLPHLFYETYYAVDQVDSSDGGRFLLSTGDLTGYGYHGDFLNGWDVDVQKEAVANCLADAGSGQIEDCPILLANNDGASRSRCPLQPPLVNEQVTGLLSALPGCNPPTAGPAAVAQQNCPANLTGTGPRLVPNVGSTVQLQNGTLATYRGCYQDNVGGRALNDAKYTSLTAMTTDTCAQFCRARGYSIAGTEYSSECYCGNSITTTMFDPGQCNMVCSGTQLEYCGGPARLSVWALSAQSNSTSSTSATTITASATPVANSTSATTITASATPIANSTSTLISLTLTSSSASMTAINSSSTASSTTISTLVTSGLATTTLQSPSSSTSSSTTTLSVTTIGVSSSISIATSTSATPGTSLTRSSSTQLSTTGFVTITTSRFTSTSTTSRPATTTTAATVPDIASATYVGCYTDIRTSRTLRAFYQGDVFTPTACAALAVARNYRYFGLEYGKECWADNTVASSASQAAESACNVACVGDQTVLCGGKDAIGVFENQLAILGD